MGLVRIISLSTFIFLSGLILSCENKYEWSNPLDAESDILPESWAPKNLQVQRISETQVQLTWEQDEKRIEGFRLERKIGSASWNNYAEIESDIFNYYDVNVTSGEEYSYRICALISGKESAFSNEVGIGSFMDIGGNIYQTIKIGTQWWMVENLKVIRYRDGEPIPHVTNNTDWSNLGSGAYCNYNNDVNNVATYGRLYNWYAVNDARGLAPAGWRVPMDADWKELEMFLGMSQTDADASGWRGSPVGGKLKEIGTVHWNSPNSDATNESGFTALPGGYRNIIGIFDNLEYYAYFWSSSENDENHAWSRYLNFYFSVVNRYSFDKRNGFSIRCVKD